MPQEASPGEERVRAAEVIATLSLATDLGTGLPLEHGLESTLIAMRLAERLDVDAATAAETYYLCLLFYVGCTADAEIAAGLFGSDLHTHLTPVIFGSRAETLAALLRALPSPDAPRPLRALQATRKLPTAIRVHGRHLIALCEVAQMLTERVGLTQRVQELFPALTERWDGKGAPAGAKRHELPLPVRIVHVARDAAFQRTLGGDDLAVRVVEERAGHAFDPEIAALVVDGSRDVFAAHGHPSAWDAVLECEPEPHLMLEADGVDRALAAMGDFADLVSPYFAGHAAGVASLAAAAAARCGEDEVVVRRAAFVHDLGRVAVATHVWQKPAPLTPDEWEQVRLHAYHCERVLNRSPFLAALAPVAAAHHERLDGSGYHRGASAATLTPTARVLAAADVYCALTSPRPHRDAMSPGDAATELGREASAGRLDADAVAAVLETAGQPVPRIERPAGLTDREAEVVGLLARGLQTKEVARVLGISAKTADRHVQNAYAKIGVSTRAAAALFAMEHGLVAWGELPIARTTGRL